MMRRNFQGKTIGSSSHLTVKEIVRLLRLERGSNPSQLLPRLAQAHACSPCQVNRRSVYAPRAACATRIQVVE